MTKKLLLILFLVGLSAHALEVDPFNTYRWNRKNALSNNGKIDSQPWYEWWYYKIVLPEQNKSFYFVYGVVNPWDSEQTLKGTRSYVGFGDFHQRFDVF